MKAEKKDHVKNWLTDKVKESNSFFLFFNFCLFQNNFFRKLAKKYRFNQSEKQLATIHKIFCLYLSSSQTSCIQLRQLHYLHQWNLIEIVRFLCRNVLFNLFPVISQQWIDLSHLMDVTSELSQLWFFDLGDHFLCFLLFLLWYHVLRVHNTWSFDHQSCM